jgi:hypothetical protein
MRKVVFSLLMALSTSLTPVVQATKMEGLWKVTDNVFDGTVKRLDNFYLEINNDTVVFLSNMASLPEGVIKNDTIFMLTDFFMFGIDWIRPINKDTLVSSPPNLKASNGLDFVRIDLTGVWERRDSCWNGDVTVDTCQLIQVRGNVLFYDSSTCFARAYLLRDSLVVQEEFEGIGIDQFTMYSNNYFEKVAPMLEAIDKIAFNRIGNQVGLEKPYVDGLLIFPVPSRDNIRILSKSSVIRLLRLFSMTGKLIEDRKIDANTCELSVSDLNDGVYLLEITTEIGKTTQKIIKN